MLSIIHVCLSILSSPSNHGSLAVFISNRVLLKDRCSKGLLRPHTWNAKKLSGRSVGLKNVPFHGGGGSSTPPESFPSSASWSWPPHPTPTSDLHPHPQRMLSNPQNGLFRRMSLGRGCFFPPSRPSPPAHPGFSHLCLSKILPVRQAVYSPPSFSVVVHWVRIIILLHDFVFNGRRGKPPFLVSRTFLFSLPPSFQNIPVWCEVKLCKILFERRERKRKRLVKMHLLDHVLNEVQLKVVFVHRKEKPLQMRWAPRERASFVVALTLKCNFSWLFGLENGGGGGKGRDGLAIISHKWQHNHITLHYKHAWGVCLFYISCVEVAAAARAP